MNEPMVFAHIKKDIRLRVGKRARDLIALGAKPIKGSFKELIIDRLEDKDTSRYRVIMYLDVPFWSLLKARRLNLPLPRGGKQRRLYFMKDMELEGYTDNETYQRYKRIYGSSSG